MRELLVRVAAKYREFTDAGKSIILEELAAATGYAGRYAIALVRSLASPTSDSGIGLWSGLPEELPLLCRDKNWADHAVTHRI